MLPDWIDVPIKSPNQLISLGLFLSFNKYVLLLSFNKYVAPNAVTPIIAPSENEQTVTTLLSHALLPPGKNKELRNPCALLPTSLSQASLPLFSLLTHLTVSWAYCFLVTGPYQESDTLGNSSFALPRLPAIWAPHAAPEVGMELCTGAVPALTL